MQSNQIKSFNSDNKVHKQHSVRKTDRHTHIHVIETNRQTGKQTDRQTDEDKNCT